MRHRSPLSVVVGWPPTSSIFILQSLSKYPLIQNIFRGVWWTTEVNMYERLKEKEYPLNQSLFTVQGGLKSTCSGTRARPYGFITAVQIITTQIPDTDNSSSTPASFTSFPQPRPSGYFLMSLPTNKTIYRVQFLF